MGMYGVSEENTNKLTTLTYYQKRKVVKSECEKTSIKQSIEVFNELHPQNKLRVSQIFDFAFWSEMCKLADPQEKKPRGFLVALAKKYGLNYNFVFTSYQKVRRFFREQKLIHEAIMKDSEVQEQLRKYLDYPRQRETV